MWEDNSIYVFAKSFYEKTQLEQNNQVFHFTNLIFRTYCCHRHIDIDKYQGKEIYSATQLFQSNVSAYAASDRGKSFEE